MNYRGKIVGITGYDGFIGKELVKSLEDAGAQVIALIGDVRNPITFSVVDHTFDYLFHFADPSSEVLFKRQQMYAADVTINGFINAVKACRDNGVKLIYPSTGLLSMTKEAKDKSLKDAIGVINALDGNHYARCKKLCEDIHLTERIDALGIRIFATYGPGEAHKRDFASVPYLFIRDMIAGRQPVIFGNGNQRRDFIYIDDVVEAILVLAEECNDPIIDLATGATHSFNQLVEVINECLFANKADNYIEPVYYDKPVGYVEDTTADASRLFDFYNIKTTFAQGIERTIYHEKSNSDDDDQPAD